MNLRVVLSWSKPASQIEIRFRQPLCTVVTIWIDEKGPRQVDGKITKGMHSGLGGRDWDGHTWWWAGSY